MQCKLKLTVSKDHHCVCKDRKLVVRNPYLTCDWIETNNWR